jgi:hypothetical protein
VLWSQHNTGQLLTVEEGALRTWTVADAAVQVKLIVVASLLFRDGPQQEQHVQGNTRVDCLPARASIRPACMAFVLLRSSP